MTTKSLEFTHMGILHVCIKFYVNPSNKWKKYINNFTLWRTCEKDDIVCADSVFLCVCFHSAYLGPDETTLLYSDRSHLYIVDYGVVAIVEVECMLYRLIWWKCFLKSSSVVYQMTTTMLRSTYNRVAEFSVACNQKANSLTSDCWKLFEGQHKLAPLYTHKYHRHLALQGLHTSV